MSENAELLILFLLLQESGFLQPRENNDKTFQTFDTPSGLA